MRLCCGAPSVKDVEEEQRGGAAQAHGQQQGGVAEEVMRRPLRPVAGRQLDPDEERRRQSAEAGPSSASSMGTRWAGGKSAEGGSRLQNGSARKSQVMPLNASPTSALLMQSGVRMSALSPSSSPSQRRGSESEYAGAEYTLANGSHHPFAVQQPLTAVSSGHGVRPLAADELRDLGFPVLSPASLPASSTHLPMAILVLDTLDEGIVSKLSHGGAANPDSEGMASGPSGSAPVRRSQPANNLVPIHINSACGAYFSITSHKEYVSVIRKLLQRDPLLTFALQKALRNLKSGEPKAVSHVTPDPSGQTSTLFGMRITPCVWEDSHMTSSAAASGPGLAAGSRPSPATAGAYSGSGTQLAALLVEHNMPYNAAEVMPRLMRDYAVLSHVPAILTLIDFQGKVLYQNASSLAYMGDLLSVKYDNHLSDGLLRLLFAYDMNNLELMLEEVLHGQEWQGVVQVPGSMRKFLAAANHAAHGAHHGSGSNRPSTINGSFTGGNRHHDELEVEFQIGNSFTTRNMLAKHRKQQNKQAAPGFLVNRVSVLQQQQQNVNSNHSGGQTPPLSRNMSIVQGAPLATAPSLTQQGVQSQRLTGNSHVGFTDDAYTPSQSGASYIHPQDQHNTQRRFMSLLDKAGKGSGSTPTAAPLHRASSVPMAGEFLPPPGSQDPLYGGQLEPNLSAEAPQLVPLGGVPSPLHARNSGAHDSDSHGGGGEDDEDDYQENGECYHEIHAIPLLDPVLDKQVIMLVQTDVTPRVELENKLADLTDAQLSMLEQLFPRHIIEYMLAGVPSKGGRNLRDLANTHEQVMVLFCDVVGFTSMSKEVEPSQVMHFLNELYEAFDALADDFDMYKLDIVGDCYIVVAGLIKEDQDGFVCVDEMDSEQVHHNAERIMEFAKAMLSESRPVLMPHNHEPVQLRIGIHTGPLVSGLVGAKMPKFTLFGDTMNTASRMESTCRPGCVHVSDAFATLLPHEQWQSTGGVQVKGKGMMQTYLHIPPAHAPGSGSGAESSRPEVEATGRTASGVALGRTISRLASFNSRITPRSHSDLGSEGAPGAGAGAGPGSRSAYPLLAILTNIIGGVDDDGLVAPSSPGHTSGDLTHTGSMIGKGHALGQTFTRHGRGQTLFGRGSGDGGGTDGLDNAAPVSRGRLANTSRRPSEGFALGHRESAAHSVGRVGRQQSEGPRANKPTSTAVSRRPSSMHPSGAAQSGNAAPGPGTTSSYSQDSEMSDVE